MFPITFDSLSDYAYWYGRMLVTYLFYYGIGFSFHWFLKWIDQKIDYLGEKIEKHFEEKKRK